MLHKILTDGASFIGDIDLYKNKVPEYVHSNLRENFTPRHYQQEAFGRFKYYWEDYRNRPQDVPTQLLYHMATGSGKTLVMAGLIIYLYEQGYRNFLFFVNSTNIIEKTRDNFFNRSSSKYLFADNISIGGKQIKINEINNFQASPEDDINIVFSTIQGLHTRLNFPKENTLTYDDFEEKEIVLISDEAHHINAETKKKGELNVDEIENILSWERTVNRIFNANKGNVLLEFTATIDLSSPQIADKYSDKLIFDYPLKQFRIDGYSKEVKVLQTDLPHFDRALQAVLLSQYRRKLFEKHKKIIKPVVLFKSKTIKESQVFFERFIDGMKNVKVSDLEKIRDTDTDEIISKVFQYLKDTGISLNNFITELREDFAKEKLISVNSKDESIEKQLAVNSLEDEDNEYRAIFAVDKLNEGWDVLNLFDIVRLYDTRDAKKGVPGKTTMAEAQLIGRGARYCPFRISEQQELYERKYDADVTNELRICEELYYHSAYNPRYIQELNTALEDIGIKAKQSVERPMKLKANFKNSSFYQSGFIFLNEQKKYNRDDIFGLKLSVLEETHKVSLKTGYSRSKAAFGSSITETVDVNEKEYKLADFGIHIVRKAINRLNFYQFSNLKSHFPNLNSISEFITSDYYLGKIKIDVSGLAKQINNLSKREKLDVTIGVLEGLSSRIVSDKIEFKGSKEFRPVLIKTVMDDKVLNFALSDSPDKEFGKSMVSPIETNYYLDLTKKDWYVFEDCFGTSEEKLLVKYIDKVHEKFKAKFDEIYLVRNERHFKIYSFEDGRPTEPDFVLFLANQKDDIQVHYQVFIEPKGDPYLKVDEWKEAFLKQLKEEHRLDQLWNGKSYTIWGMPFYNEAHRQGQFGEAMDRLLED